MWVSNKVLGQQSLSQRADLQLLAASRDVSAWRDPSHTASAWWDPYCTNTLLPRSREGETSLGTGWAGWSLVSAGGAQLSSWVVQGLPDTFPGKTPAVGNSKPPTTIQAPLGPHGRLVCILHLDRTGQGAWSESVRDTHIEQSSTLPSIPNAPHAWLDAQCLRKASPACLILLLGMYQTGSLTELNKRSSLHRSEWSDFDL